LKEHLRWSRDRRRQELSDQQVARSGFPQGAQLGGCRAGVEAVSPDFGEDRALGDSSLEEFLDLSDR
jgi:hypothetical protein